MPKDWYSIPERMVDLLAAPAAGIFFAADIYVGHEVGCVLV